MPCVGASWSIHSAHQLHFTLFCLLSGQQLLLLAASIPKAVNQGGRRAVLWDSQEAGNTRQREKHIKGQKRDPEKKKKKVLKNKSDGCGQKWTNGKRRKLVKGIEYLGEVEEIRQHRISGWECWRVSFRSCSSRCGENCRCEAFMRASLLTFALQWTQGNEWVAQGTLSCQCTHVCDQYIQAHFNVILFSVHSKCIPYKQVGKTYLDTEMTTLNYFKN